MHVCFCYSSFKCEICVIWPSERDGNSVKQLQNFIYVSLVLFVQQLGWFCRLVNCLVASGWDWCTVISASVKSMYAGCSDFSIRVLLFYVVFNEVSSWFIRLVQLCFQKFIGISSFSSFGVGKEHSLFQLQGVKHFELIPDLFLFCFSALLIAAMLLSRTVQVFPKKHSVKCNRS